MKGGYSFFLLSLFFILSHCTKDVDLPQELPIQVLEVRYLDIDVSCCTGNVKFLNGETITDANGNREDGFAISNIEDFNTNGNIQFGDTLLITFEVLSDIPDNYPESQMLCLCQEALIPIQILSVE